MLGPDRLAQCDTAYEKPPCTQEEAEQGYKQLFPDYSERFAEYEHPPSAYPELMDAEADTVLEATAAQSETGQSLLGGKILEEIVHLQRR